MQMQQHNNMVQMVEGKVVPLVPAFRGFNISGLNLAETGHSTMQTSKKSWLSVATWRDTCMMIIQDRDYVSFYTNSAKVTGKGLNVIQQCARQQKEESSFINSCCEALESGDIEVEVIVEMDPNKYFLPNSKSKHRVPTTFSETNPDQRANKRKNDAAGSSISKKKKTTQPKEVVSVRKAGMTANNKKNKSTDDSNSDYQDNDVDKVAANEEKRKLQSNPPVLIRMSGIITNCSGCEEYFTDKYRKPPHDIIFKLMTYKKQPVGNGKCLRNDYKSPAYSHA